MVSARRSVGPGLQRRDLQPSAVAGSPGRRGRGLPWRFGHRGPPRGGGALGPRGRARCRRRHVRHRPVGPPGTGQLHLIRDRFGEKPLYYGWIGRRLAFGSELKALCTVPGFAPEIDRDAVALYLRHNCIPAPHTIYRGWPNSSPANGSSSAADSAVGVLPEPIVLLVGTRRHRPGPAPTHRGITGRDGGPTGGGAVGVGGARMEADVPVGAFLSGGIDSSVVVALMQQHSTHRVRTFTIGFANPLVRRVGRRRRRGRPPRDRPHPAAGR